MPHVGEPGRLLAPDLIGMGQSRKPEIAYRFEDQARYLEAWFDVCRSEIRFGPVTCGFSVGQAALVYSLVCARNRIPAR